MAQEELETYPFERDPETGYMKALSTEELIREEGEVDLFAELMKAFPADTISRVGRGAKGADIIQRVMDAGKEAGCIVYESKNVSPWQSAFLTQAKKYRTQYETPYVIVASRVLPKKKPGMCVVDDIPIVEPRIAVSMASVMTLLCRSFEIARMPSRPRFATLTSTE